MSTKRIYLAGAISCHYKNNEMEKATEWRAKLINELLDDIADKCDSKWDWFDPTLNFEENYKVVNNRTVLMQNLHYLNKSDIMICNLDKLEESPGTLYEIFYFGEVLRRPIICIGWSEWAKSPHVEPYIDYILEPDKVMRYLDNLYYQ